MMDIPKQYQEILMFFITPYSKHLCRDVLIPPIFIDHVFLETTDGYWCRVSALESHDLMGKKYPSGFHFFIPKDNQKQVLNIPAKDLHFLSDGSFSAREGVFHVDHTGTGKQLTVTIVEKRMCDIGIKKLNIEFQPDYSWGNHLKK